MIRSRLAGKGVGAKHGFQWRSHEIMRIEGFSDAVFAFAVTLLVVSLEVPKTYDELSEMMSGFVAFACASTLLFLVWYNQYIFFRRYGLQDATTITLNGALLFVVLFFVYPLKFLFALLVRMFTGHGRMVHLHDGSVVEAIRNDQWSELMIIYGLGYIAVYSVFALLYTHASRKRGDLELTTLEVFDTRTSIRESVLNICVGLLSIAIVGLGGPQYAALSGFAYALIGPILGIHGTWNRRRRDRLITTLTAGTA
jgi:hypothetical protein